MAHLLIQTATGTPVLHELNGGTVTIGRTPENTIVLDDPSVSSRHAELHANGRCWTLRDLGSSNGTTLNGQPFREGWVNSGDTIHFARVECRFQNQELVENGRPIRGAKRSKSRVLLVIGVAAVVLAIFGTGSAVFRRHLPTVTGEPVAPTLQPTSSQSVLLSQEKASTEKEDKNASELASEHPLTVSSPAVTKGNDAKMEQAFQALTDLVEGCLYNDRADRASLKLDRTNGWITLRHYPVGIDGDSEILQVLISDLDVARTGVKSFPGRTECVVLLHTKGDKKTIIRQPCDLVERADKSGVDYVPQGESEKINEFGIWTNSNKEAASAVQAISILASSFR